jgi:hypothetical protein
MGARIDHVLYAVSDLDAGARRIAAQLGRESLAGGRHEGWGTANRIVPLGPDYLGLIGVEDRAVAATSDLGRVVLDSGDGLLGWAVATDDLDGVAARLGLQVEHGSRTRPDGLTLRWRLAGVAPALTSGALPFFIQWESPAELHPGGDPAAPPGIAWVQVREGARDELREWLGAAALPVRFADRADRGITAAGIGEAVLI